MPANTRLPGHELVSEGAPFTSEGRRKHFSIRHSTRGAGHGLCSCGELSAELPSAAARKRWHREHKDALRG